MTRPHERFFVLWARDPDAPQTIRGWADRRRARVSSCLSGELADPEELTVAKLELAQCTQADRIADLFEVWQNGEDEVEEPTPDRPQDAIQEAARLRLKDYGIAAIDAAQRLAELGWEAINEAEAFTGTKEKEAARAAFATLYMVHKKLSDDETEPSALTGDKADE